MYVIQYHIELHRYESISLDDFKWQLCEYAVPDPEWTTVGQVLSEDDFEERCWKTTYCLDEQKKRLSIIKDDESGYRFHILTESVFFRSLRPRDLLHIIQEVTKQVGIDYVPVHPRLVLPQEPEPMETSHQLQAILDTFYPPDQASTTMSDTSATSATPTCGPQAQTTYEPGSIGNLHDIARDKLKSSKGKEEEVSFSSSGED